jgi:ATP-binding cassette subfamily A (ABC1) protein 5
VNNDIDSFQLLQLDMYFALVLCRMLIPKMRTGFEPIMVKTHPFQQTSQPQEFNMGTFSSAIFIGMSFILVPVSLAVDMVYDREVSI